MATIKRMLLLLCVTAIIFSCKKESGRHCWIIVDNLGNELSRVCNKTEAELIQCSTDHSCGTFNGGAPLTSCNYFIDEGEKACWMVENKFYQNISENEMRHNMTCYFGSPNATLQKVACDYCTRWFNRTKTTLKPSNRILYGSIKNEQYCGDTSRTIFQGRQIILIDNADTLQVIQFSSNGTTW